MDLEGKFRPLRVFVSYSFDDDAAYLQLEKSIKLLERQGYVTLWNGRKILPGDDWDHKVREELEDADLFVALVSFEFLASSYIDDVELARALERRAAGDIDVIPIIIDDCPWRDVPSLAALNALPLLGNAIASYPRPNTAWNEIYEGLKQAVEARWQGQPTRFALQQSDAAAGGGTDDQADAWRDYLLSMRNAFSYVDVRGIGAERVERMALDTVYTRLKVRGSDHDRVGRSKTHKRGASGDDSLTNFDRTVELREILAEHSQVALIGDPGTGKTTFLRFVGQILARAGLGELEALAQIGLDDGTITEASAVPVPIFVKAAEFAAFLHDSALRAAGPMTGAAQLDAYLDYWQQGQRLSLASGALSQRLRTGGCFLLIDGLDEVAGLVQRETLAEQITHVLEQETTAHAANRYLVACRTRAWEGKTQILGGLEVCHLADFEPAQIALFCERWCRALFQVSASSPLSDHAEAYDYHGQLTEAIRDNPSGATFNANPLMLTVLAVVHWNRRSLPEQRAELYAAAVDYLIKSRDALSEVTPFERLERLQALALVMALDGVKRQIGADEAAKLIAERAFIGVQSARDWLEEEALLSGILVSRADGEFEFWHLTFLEFLAARALAQHDDRWRLLQPHLYADRWHEIVLLLAGALVSVGGRAAVTRLVESILADAGAALTDQARAVALVSRMRRDVRPYGFDPAERTEFSTLSEAVLGIFMPGSALGVEQRVRVEVARALGEVGDPRIEEAPARVAVAGGEFLMGAQANDPDGPNYDVDAFRDEGPVHAVVSPDLAASRYPITVSQYAVFLTEGAQVPAHWQPQGWTWWQAQERDVPEDWEAQLRVPNAPVVGVSWYEADACARWLDGSLPTEEQWEWLARGRAARRFPWGDEPPDDQRAVFDAPLDRVGPVGISPLGWSPEGLSDLAGNVDEWTASPWRDSYGVKEADGNRRVLRGGAFGYSARDLRAACRYNFAPGNAYSSVGFRVVWLSRGGRG
ncbi:MAG: SUMF1/EgtB/PvdO family nonheme iron enzyme [Pseudomonadota bacterium]